MVAWEEPVGSDASAACGRCSELSEWQRSADEEGALSPTKMPGTATGKAGHRRGTQKYTADRLGNPITYGSDCPFCYQMASESSANNKRGAL